MEPGQTKNICTVFFSTMLVIFIQSEHIIEIKILE